MAFTYADQDTLALEVDISDRELVGERHGCGMSTVVAGGLAELLYSFKLAIGEVVVNAVELPEKAN